MYYTETISKTKKKTYKCKLLRESYREGKKVKNRTLANLTHCKDEDTDAIKLALKHKKNLYELGNITEDLEVKEGKSVGAVYIVNETAKKLGIEVSLGEGRQAQLAMWQIIARVLAQGSRLSAIRLAEIHACCEILKLKRGFNEDDLYKNLGWLSEEQEKIETILFKKRRNGKKPELFLYDVTSSYLEGNQNALGAYGYNRDRKKGKKQIVIGLLCDETGAPVSVEVFKGNTGDTKTFASQVKKTAKKFGCSNVIFVGDRGMIKRSQIESLCDEDFNYITAISKPEMNTLLDCGVIQLGLFDEKITEIEALWFNINEEAIENLKTKITDKEKLKLLKDLVLFKITEESIEVLQENIAVDKLKSLINKEFSRKKLLNKLMCLKFSKEEIEIILKGAKSLKNGKLLFKDEFEKTLEKLDFEEKEIELVENFCGEKIRYILRRNPIREEELCKSREDKKERILLLLEEQNRYLTEHPGAKVDVALKKINNLISRLKVDKWISVEPKGRNFILSFDEEKLKEIALLDGCYVIKSDLPQGEISAQMIHDRYKDLTLVEKAFRSMKTTHLEVRPVYVRKEEHVRGHVLVVMLAYMVMRKLREAWNKIDFTIAEGLESLSTLTSTEIKVKGRKNIHSIPIPRDNSKELIEALDIKLPNSIPSTNCKVVTRHKLKNRRK